jgi:hypothetical protein
VYVQHWHFNPGKNAPILDSKYQLGAALTNADRRAVQERLGALVRAASSRDAEADGHRWTSLHASAEPALDSSGGPALQVHLGDEVMSVGVTRSNILNAEAGFEFAAGLVEARLREELRPSATQKTARADVESDLVLLQQLLTSQAEGLASTGGVEGGSGTLVSEAVH